MTYKTVLLLIIILIGNPTFSQQLDTDKLNLFFDTLEERNEAMGSITISKNGSVIYSKAFGYRYIDEEEKIDADINTNYKIWSITKLYTATMIMQLVEEEKLSLDTKLIHFYPQIPNAEFITIKDMLNHRSGIHDFTQNDTSEDWDTYIKEPLTHTFMVNTIAQYPSDFYPNEDFRYSNSNYLLLGYIIEKLDGNLYETSLSNRILTKLGMTNTYFGVGALDSVENKAYSYTYDRLWTSVDEGGFSGLIPAGAGGIVSTTEDMNLFMHGLCSGQLITKESLNQMIPKNEFYGLGIMQTSFQGMKTGYGHTGGYIASESSLYYYPEDSLSIAYATNGIVIRKEDILNNVLKIYHNQPFDVSMNRNLQTLLIFGLGFIFFVILRLKFRSYLSTEKLLYLGYIIAILFWIGAFISGHLYGNYSPIKDAVTILDSFYSGSGTFMSSILLIAALLFLPYIWSLYKTSQQLNIHMLPLLPLFFIPVSFIGSSLFSYPNELYTIFINIILFIMLGPLLAIFMWRKRELSKLKWFSLACLMIMIFSIALVFSRPSFPEFIHSYWGIIQRGLYLGWTLWLYFLSTHFIKLLQGKKLDKNTIRE